MKQRNAGFILIYVVVLVAAIALILYQINQMKSGVPQQQEKIVNRLLQQTEATLLVDFILADSRRIDLGIDSRYQRFRQLLATDPARVSEIGEALEQLRSALAQYGFNIQGRDELGAGSQKWEDKELYLAEGGGRLVSIGSHDIQLGNRRYQVMITPGNALPNLNALPYDALVRYLQYLAIPEKEARELAADLIDWRDKDDFRTDQRGAEQEYYRAQSPSYLPRNDTIKTWQELAYLRNMNAERLHLLQENFMIARPELSQVLTTRLKPEALAALADLKPETVNNLLTDFANLMKRQNEGHEDVSSGLLSSEARILENYISWLPEAETLRFELSSDSFSLTLDYDTVARRVIGRW
jgi:hypothetical protein